MKRLVFKTNDEYMLDISQRIKKIRKEMKISREKLSIISGVPTPTIRRFEDTGNISLYSLVGIVSALGYENELDNFCSKIIYKDIKDID